MAIELTDPRYAAIDQIGYALGQRYGQMRQAKKDDKSLAEWDQTRQDLKNPQYTSEELASAWKQMEQKYGHLVGVNPLEGITQSKKAWETATDDAQRDAAHQQADYYRRLADIKGMSLAGYAADDPAKTPYRLEAPPLWEGTQKAGRWLFGPMLDANQERGGLLTAALNQGKQFLKEPGLNPTQGQGLLTSALNNQFLKEPDSNLITMEDIDRASGGQLSAEAKAAALQMARQRAQAEIKSGAPATNFFRQLLRKGYDPESASRLMQIVGMDLKHMQEELQDTTAQDLGRQMVEAAKAGDYGQATSLALQIDVRTNSNLGSNYLKTLQQEKPKWTAINAQNGTVLLMDQNGRVVNAGNFAKPEKRYAASGGMIYDTGTGQPVYVKPSSNGTAKLGKNEQWAQNYELNGIHKDQAIIDKYNANIDPATGRWNTDSMLTDAQKIALDKEAQAAMGRMNQYWRISSGGAYNPGQQTGKTENEAQVDAIISRIKEQHPDATDSEIFQYLAQTLGYGQGE